MKSIYAMPILMLLGACTVNTESYVIELATKACASHGGIHSLNYFEIFHIYSATCNDGEFIRLGKT